MPSALDMFKIGIGPSSSHTLGPMKMGSMFAEELRAGGLDKETAGLRIDLYGSLSLTGRGHQTDQAVLLGLAGEKPESVNIEAIPAFMEAARKNRELVLAGGSKIPFDMEKDLVFNEDCLPLHENGLRICAFADAARSEKLLQKSYYSVGGGVVVEEAEFGKKEQEAGPPPYPFSSARELFEHCRDTGLSISGLALRNEEALHSRQEVVEYCGRIWETMRRSMKRGLENEGLLPGPLKVMRRAPLLYRMLLSRKAGNHFLHVMDWVNLFALAVSEENAAGGRVVTAPTNGACGVLPAVLAYYDKFVSPVTDDALLYFFLASGSIGQLYRMNASISGAEVGCQGEIGVACSMAAAGLAELSGGAPEQVCAAAEIAMEHNLGLTCDPVGGQVQIPCIERNAINAVKAINAALMARTRVSPPTVSLDKVIQAMFATGRDINAKYRETSQGGLACAGLKRAAPFPACTCA